MKGQEVTNTQIEIVTSIVRQIRSLTEHIGAQCDRPVLLTVRIPHPLALSKRSGLDLETSIKEDLIDFLVVGGG